MSPAARNAVTFRALTISSFCVIFNLLACGLCQAQTELVLTSEDLLEKPLRTESGGIAGAVRALVLDPVQGSVRLVVIDLRDPPERTVAIPWSSLTVKRDGSFWLSVSEDELVRAPSYPLLPAGRSERALPRILASGTTYAPTDIGAVPFDPSRVASYRGEVVGTMTAPLQGEGDAAIAIIDVGSDEIRAHLGPSAYLEQIGCDLDPGESVVVEGSPSVVDGRTIVVVSRVFVRDRAFLLRNSDGSPRWK